MLLKELDESFGLFTASMGIKCEVVLVEPVLVPAVLRHEFYAFFLVLDQGRNPSLSRVSGRLTQFLHEGAQLFDAEGFTHDAIYLMLR